MSSSKSSKIIEILKTFEQPGLAQPAKPPILRNSLQEQLKRAKLENESITCKYKQVLENNENLNIQVNTQQKELESLRQHMEEKKRKYKILKNDFEQIKQQLAEYNREVEKNSSKPLQESKKMAGENSEKYIPNNNEILEERQRNDLLLVENLDAIDNRIENDNINIADSGTANVTDSETKLAKLLDDYGTVIEKQSTEIGELKNQLVSVLTLAETLEQELNDEKRNHKKTKELLEVVHCENKPSPTRGKRSQSYSAAEVSYVYRKNPPPKILVPLLNIPIENSISPTQRDRVSGGQKKRSRRFLRKFGKSQKMVNEYTDNGNSITSPPVQPSPRREIVAGGPDSKQQVQQIPNSGSNNPIPMTDEQLKRELEVLLLLGESLQAELVKERKNHQATQKLLQETQGKVEELKQRGLTGLISRKSKIPGSQPAILEKEGTTVAEELNAVAELREIDETSFSHGKANIYDLKDIVSDMICLSDLFLANYRLDCG